MVNTPYRFRYLALLTAIVYIAAAAYFQRWDTRIVQGGDSWGYYAYLPATFIYGDLADISDSYLQRFSYTDFGAHFPDQGGVLPIAENGHRLIKYTCGVAILQLPFFAIGHSWASLDSNYETDGFSFPYIISVMFGNLVYLLFAAFLLFRLLVAHLNAKIAFWTLLVIALGTNLFNSAVYRPCMSHAYLASLYAGLMYASWQFYTKPGTRWIVFAALCAGLITLIRPVEILCLAIPLAYGLSSWQTVKTRLAFWGQHWTWLVMAALIFILCGIPQLLYWKYASGHWIFDGYPGETFDFAHPKIIAGLWSTQNGWFIYSPIMILAMVGIVALFKKRDWLWPVLLILPAHVYIAYSWWCWNYINGFGSRPMVALYSLLAIPMAHVLFYMDRRRWSRVLMLGLTTLAIGLQLFQNWQHSKGILWSEMAHSAYYKAVFGKTAMTYDALVAFDSQQLQPDSTKLVFSKQLVTEDYESIDTAILQVSEPVFSGRLALKITPEQKYANVLIGNMKELGLEAGQWLRIAAWCYKEKKEAPWYIAPSIVIEYTAAGQPTEFTKVHIDSKLNNPGYGLWGGAAGHWGYVRLWRQLPENLRPEDNIKIYFMAEQEVVYADEVVVELWNEN